MLEAELASIAKRMVEISGVSEIEFDTAADGFPRPSLFFPPVEQDTTQPTFSSFGFENSLFVKVFDNSTKAAMEKAAAIVFALNQDRKQVPLVDESGNFTGKPLRLKQLSHKRTDEGTAQIYCTWSSIYAATEKTNPAANAIVRKIGLKKEA